MSVNTTRQVYGWLVSSSSVTSLIPQNDIKIGYPRVEDNFPCITITPAGGVSYGYLGYGTANTGSKIRRENSIIQIDVWSKNGFYETDNVSEEITKVMISGTCREQSANNFYNDETGLYRRNMSYSYVYFHDD